MFDVWEQLVEKIRLWEDSGHFQTEPKNVNYRKLFGKTSYSAVRELRLLVEKGFLRMEGERRAAHYRPQPSFGAAQK